MRSIRNCRQFVVCIVCRQHQVVDWKKHAVHSKTSGNNCLRVRPSQTLHESAREANPTQLGNPQRGSLCSSERSGRHNLRVEQESDGQLWATRRHHGRQRAYDSPKSCTIDKFGQKHSGLKAHLLQASRDLLESHNLTLLLCKNIIPETDSLKSKAYKRVSVELYPLGVSPRYIRQIRKKYKKDILDTAPTPILWIA